MAKQKPPNDRLDKPIYLEWRDRLKVVVEYEATEDDLYFETKEDIEYAIDQGALRRIPLVALNKPPPSLSFSSYIAPTAGAPIAVPPGLRQYSWATTAAITPVSSADTIVINWHISY